MNCRKPLILALGLLMGVGGCTYPIAELRLPSPKEAQKPAEEVPHKAATYVAFGNLRAAAALAKEGTPEQQKQYREEAGLAYAKAIEVDPTHLPAYAALARLHENCADHAGALGVYARAATQNDRNAGLWYEMGMCQCRLKNWIPAIENLRKACDLEPKNRQYAKTLGLALARTGQIQESFTVLCRISGAVQAHIDLARMLHHLKQPQLARKQVVMALRMDPSQVTARALLAELDNARSQGVQTASSKTSGGMTEAVGRTGESSGLTGMLGRPIPVPPFPKISIHAQE
jgi:tetratricopeptide (TPR) repeat protein